MSGQRTHFRSWQEDLEHREHRQQSLLKVQGLQALLDEWEANPVDSDQYRDYLVHLRARVRSARVNYEAMRP